MPTGPKGQNRPADVIGNAVHVRKVLTGEADDGALDDGKDKATQTMNRKGGAGCGYDARAESGVRTEGGGEAVGQKLEPAPLISFKIKR